MLLRLLITRDAGLTDAGLHLFIGLDLVEHAEAYRIEYNMIRPHEALAWNTPYDVHLGLADLQALALED